jgi:hypothetical protein
LVLEKSGRNSAVECQLPKLDVVGSIPIARSKNYCTKGHVFSRKTLPSGFDRVPKTNKIYIRNEVVLEQSERAIPIATFLNMRSNNWEWLKRSRNRPLQNIRK